MSRLDNNSKNGKRTIERAPDNNTDESHEEDNAEKIRVGREYQAVCPPMIPQAHRNLEALDEKSLLIWCPSPDVTDEKMTEYIAMAKDRYGYNEEQALGMLVWHKYDIERATQDLVNFVPRSEEWSATDQVLFEQAFQFHGKSFNRIRQMLPDKSMASLVKNYYSWKKSRQKMSVMDQKEKDLLKNTASDNNTSERESVDNSDQDEKSGSTVTKPPVKEPETVGAILLLECAGCGVSCSEVNGTIHGKLCNSCFHHFQRTGCLRPTSGPSVFGSRRTRPTGSEKHKRRPPRGIYINENDLVTLANASQAEQENRHNDILVAKEREIASHLSTIQKLKQKISSGQKKIEDLLVGAEPPESTNRVSMRWTSDEYLLAVEGVKQHGKDFATIADTIGTKTESQIKTFFVNCRRRYNLDSLVREFESNRVSSTPGNSSSNTGTPATTSTTKPTAAVTNDNPKTATAAAPELMEIDLDDDNTSTANPAPVE